jgi:hypothetical protein
MTHCQHEYELTDQLWKRCKHCGAVKPTGKKSGTAVTGWAIMDEHKVIAITALLMTVVEKFLTNFFKEN